MWLSPVTIADFIQIPESDGKAPSLKAAKLAAPCFGIEPSKVTGNSRL
jgi:hypothetical protein